MKLLFATAIFAISTNCMFTPSFMQDERFQFSGVPVRRIVSPGNSRRINIQRSQEPNFIRGRDIRVYGTHNTAIGNNHDIYGYGNYLRGASNTAIGVNNIGIGQNLYIQGAENAAYGRQNRVQGYGNQVSGQGNLVGGESNSIQGNGNQVNNQGFNGQEDDASESSVNFNSGTRNVQNSVTSNGQFSRRGNSQQGNRVQGQNNKVVGRGNVIF